MPIDRNESVTIDRFGGTRHERFQGSPAEIVRFSEMINGRPLWTETAEAFVEDLRVSGVAERVSGGAVVVYQSVATASR
jgi:hypothetical protein